jgi:hypothetical protein
VFHKTHLQRCKVRLEARQSCEVYGRARSAVPLLHRIRSRGESGTEAQADYKRAVLESSVSIQQHRGARSRTASFEVGGVQRDEDQWRAQRMLRIHWRCLSQHTVRPFYIGGGGQDDDGQDPQLDELAAELSTAVAKRREAATRAKERALPISRSIKLNAPMR